MIVHRCSAHDSLHSTAIEHPTLFSSPIYKPSTIIQHLSVPSHTRFAYSVNDYLTGDIKSHEESRHGDLVQGSYSLIDPDGYRRIVHYTAGPRSGFNAIVRREPLHMHSKLIAPKSAVATPQHIDYQYVDHVLDHHHHHQHPTSYQSISSLGSRPSYLSNIHASTINHHSSIINQSPVQSFSENGVGDDDSYWHSLSLPDIGVAAAPPSFNYGASVLATGATASRLAYPSLAAHGPPSYVSVQTPAASYHY